MADKSKLSKLNVNRGEMATALDRGFKRFAEAAEEEMDARIAAAITTHRNAHHRTLRQWFAELFVSARS